MGLDESLSTISTLLRPAALSVKLKNPGLLNNTIIKIAGFRGLTVVSTSYILHSLFIGSCVIPKR
jgi:hypothetical protein